MTVQRSSDSSIVVERRRRKCQAAALSILLGYDYIELNRPRMVEMNVPVNRDHVRKHVNMSENQHNKANAEHSPNLYGPHLSAPMWVYKEISFTRKVTKFI